MIPLSDEGAQQSRQFPIVNIAIIVLNFVMFGVELEQGIQLSMVGASFRRR